jgi:hypothetical protein
MKSTYGSRIFTCFILITLAFTIYFCASQVAVAQNLKSQVQNLETTLKENNLRDNKDVTHFLEYLHKLIDLRSEVAGFDTSIAASGGFDNGRYSSSAVDAQMGVERTFYPHALRFKTASKFIFSPSSIQNEMTSILVNYDYYLSKNVEVYGFIERFSDSYMGIKQRYESGFGFLLEFDSEPSKGLSLEGAKEMVTLQLYDDLRENFARCINESPINEETKETILLDLQRIDREHKNIRYTLQKKRSPFTWVIAFSLFSEVEQVEVNTGTVDPETHKDIIVPIEPGQFYRLTLRPSFRWRLSDVVSLSSWFYWKASLRKVKSFFDDSRLDIYSNLDFKLAKDLLWGGAASVSLDYQFHYDWMPPMLTNEQIDYYLERNLNLLFVRAGKFHNYLAVKFKFAF